MSEDKPHGATTIRASKSSGNGSKLLLGAVAAAVLIGGGYYAYTTYGTSQPSTQTAYNDQSYQEPVRAGPLEPSTQTASNDASASDESATAPAAATTQAATPARRRAPVQTAANDAVPEETVGIIPVSDSTTDSEPIVVTGQRHPIWTRTPSARRLATLYPQLALERGREGEARLHCTVQEGGALDCVRVEETPGFGAAAVRVAHSFRHATQLADGSDATGSPVNLRVVFRMADEDRRHG